MKNNSLNIQNYFDKSIFKKVEEIILILKIQIIKNNYINNISKNVYYKIYNIMVEYIIKNINSFDINAFQNNIDKIIKNLINCYKEEK